MIYDFWDELDLWIRQNNHDAVSGGNLGDLAWSDARIQSVDVAYLIDTEQTTGDLLILDNHGNVAFGIEGKVLAVWELE